MKKFLSLALTLALCFSLTVPAFAANKAGDTTITDANGTYTLSKPILYTISRSELEKINMDSVSVFINGEPINEDYFGSAQSYLRDYFFAKAATIYAVPEGTNIELPDGILTSDYISIDLAFKNGTCYATEANTALFPGLTSVKLSDTEYLAKIDLELANPPDNDSWGSSPSEIDAGAIYFYVTGNTAASNPFAGNTPNTSESANSPATPTFTDVVANAYYANSVAWAVDKSITAGTSKTTFSPNSTCTTAQILTFLWRSQGSPEPTSKTNTFTDIKESDYFYKAALWAKENNIVSRDSTAFNGNTPCTRSMAVLYIWRAAGFYAAEKHSNFTDVAATTIYAPAVDWAVEQGVTSGTSKTTFSPDTTCTRAQIVTFLYRAFSK